MKHVEIGIGQKEWQLMPDSPDYTFLKAKQREIRGGFPETMGLRVHRSISWIGRAEREIDDPDARFLFLWIAFNAAYADEDEFQAIRFGEREAFSVFFKKVVGLDVDRRIYDAVWDSFSGPIRLLMDNKYVFNPFWQHHNGIPGFDDWEERFNASSRRFACAVRESDSISILSFVFDRLYVLRNQIVHGGATWDSSVNRDQVRDGAAILGFLVPVFVNIMLDNPHENWGRPFYPVVS